MACRIITSPITGEQAKSILWDEIYNDKLDFLGIEMDSSYTEYSKDKAFEEMTDFLNKLDENLKPELENIKKQYIEYIDNEFKGGNDFIIQGRNFTIVDGEYFIEGKKVGQETFYKEGFNDFIDNISKRKEAELESDEEYKYTLNKEFLSKFGDWINNPSSIDKSKLNKIGEPKYQELFNIKNEKIYKLFSPDDMPSIDPENAVEGTCE